MNIWIALFLGLLSLFVNSTAVNISAQLSVSVPVFNSLVYIQSGIAGSYGNSLFDFFEKLLGFCFVILFFHSGCTIVHSYQQYTGVYIFPHLCQNFFLFLFFFNDSYPDECKVVSHCGFDLYLPGFHGDAVVKNWPAVQETVEMWVQSLGREDPLK